MGLEAFSQEDWQLPAEIAAQFGPRFTAWQEQGTIAESWAKCEEHARKMKEILPPEKEQAGFNNDSGLNGHTNESTTKKRVIPTQCSLWQLDE